MTNEKNTQKSNSQPNQSSRPFIPSLNQKVFIASISRKGVIKELLTSKPNQSKVTYYTPEPNSIRKTEWFFNSDLREFKEKKEENKYFNSLVKSVHEAIDHAKKYKEKLNKDSEEYHQAHIEYSQSQDAIDSQKSFNVEMSKKGIYIGTARSDQSSSSLQINVKKLHPDAIIPKYQTDGSSGFDLHALEDMYVEPGQTVLIKTGLAFEIPVGLELQIRPRSGMSKNTKLRVSNSPGSIDADYRGDVGILLDNIYAPSEDDSVGYMTLDIKGNFVDGGRFTHSSKAYLVKKGDRVAQGIIAPIVQANLIEVEELSDTERGSGGFGHSGTSK